MFEMTDQFKLKVAGYVSFTFWCLFLFMGLLLGMSISDTIRQRDLDAAWPLVLSAGAAVFNIYIWYNAEKVKKGLWKRLHPLPPEGRTP